MNLLGDLNTASGTEEALHVTVDGELTGSQGTDHEETGADTSVAATEAELLADLGKAGDGALTRETLGLVDLAQHGISGLGDDGGGKTGNETGSEVDGGLGAVGHGVLVEGAQDGLGDLLEDDELGHGVGDPVGKDLVYVG